MRLQPPMTMMDFFQKSEGTWFTQRSVHHFDCRDDESGDSNLIVRVISTSDDRVRAICEQQNIDPSLAVGGASFAWEDNLAKWRDDDRYAAVLVDVPDPDDPRRGHILRDRGYVESIPVLAHYWFADDGVLTIDTDYDLNRGQERCWFLTDDFRVRVSTVRTAGGVNLMAYCSETRCVSPQNLEAAIAHNQSRTAQ